VGIGLALLLAASLGQAQVAVPALTARVTDPKVSVSVVFVAAMCMNIMDRNLSLST
jgi:hypothetical protein